MRLFNWLFGRPEPSRVDEGEPHRRRGLAHLTQGEYQEAADAFRQALAVRPDDPDLRRALATCCHALGDDAGAATEAIRTREVMGRVAEWWARRLGQALPLIWEGKEVGHFALGRIKDYPRLKGGWTSSGSRQAGRFGAILLRPDYCNRPELLRVSLGCGVGGEYLVSGVSTVVDDEGNQEAILLDLTVVTLPNGWEGS